MSGLIHQYFKPLVIVLLFWTFATRVWRLDEPKTYVFDEVYHAVTAKLIARNDLRAYEWWNPAPEPTTAVDWLHPPLAKYTQAASMLLFGETAFGWRFSSVIFGVLVVFMTLKLALELFEHQGLALLAGFLVSLDGLVLAQSRIAMNDIHVTFFILLTLFMYLRHVHSRSRTTGYLWLTGLSAGLAMGSKWSGLYALVIVWMVEGMYVLKGLFKNPRTELAQIFGWYGAQLIGALLIVPAVLYVASYTHMFLQGKTLFCHQQQAIQGECYYTRMFWHKDDEQVPGAKPFFEGYVSHFVEMHRQIWAYQTGLTATHGYQSRPWQWFLDLRPVWYYVDYAQDQRGDIYNIGNPLIFWLGDVAVVITLSMMGWYLARNLDKPQIIWQMGTMSKLSFLITSYLMVWLPWQFSPRIMFFYHYLPAVPLLCILLAYWLVKLWRRGPAEQGAVALLVAMIFATFVVWYPHWTGIRMPITFKEKVYFVVPSWR